MDRKVLIIIIIVILGGALLWVYLSGSTEPTSMPDGIVLFYGNTCSHCKVVEDFIKQNDIESKVEFTQLEVFLDKNNSSLLLNTAEFCKIDTTQGAPVPFLWDGQKCYVGQVEVINFFKNETGIQ